jgi:hypothetical protein
MNFILRNCKKPFTNFFFFFSYQVSATDPDCGVNAIVNYTLGEGMRKLSDFEIRSDTGEVCISGDLDYEARNSYEFPIIATDRGKFNYFLSLSHLILMVIYMCAQVA